MRNTEIDALCVNQFLYSEIMSQSTQMTNDLSIEPLH